VDGSWYARWITLSTVKCSDFRKLTATPLQPALLSALLTLLLGPPILATLMILFGAPLTTHIPHTLLAATHVSLLAILPLVYVHGVDKKKWMDIAAALLPLDEAFGGTVGALLGCWLGAIPIPLDWYVCSPHHMHLLSKI
jgi:GPI ethanolamine phosphate transferase 2/3 subunit F